jgi:hypothetical protein
MNRLAIPFLLAATVAAAAVATGGPFHGTQRDRGTVVELTVRRPADPAAPLLEGQAAEFSLALRDEASGSKLNGAYPSVWMVRRLPAEGDSKKRCSAAVAALLSGGLDKPSALDLNTYYVLTLNGDGSINVVDPRFGFGGTQLLGMMQLDGPGFDWALAAGGDRLFVSVPSANRVAVIDTVHWKLLPSVDAGPKPRRVVAAPDGGQVFVATERGVAAIRVSDSTVAGTIATGRGEHDLAISGDGRFLLATSREDGTASLIDARRNAILGVVDAGASPISAAFSALGGTFFVAGSGGRVTVIDPERQKTVATIEARAGLAQIRVAPGGRFVFLPNPERDVVQIIDTASNRVVQTAAIDGGPFDVSFTQTLAYIRRLRSEAVEMIPLDGLGKEGAPVAVVDFPAGEYPFGKAPRLTAAAGIVTAPDENAVIIANPADKHIYYYKEGMAAPSGHFSNYGHYAQAVMVLDRSIRPAGGVYATTAILPPAGEYDVAVFVNAPRTVSCFPLTVAPDPVVAAKRRGPITVEHLTAERVLQARRSSPLAFRLRDAATQQPRAGVDDAMVLIVQAGGSWYTRQPLAAAGDGKYETSFAPPAPGVYYVYVGAPSIGLRTSNPQYLTIEAR